MKEGGRGCGSELGSDLYLDPWKILWIRIRQNDADPLDPDPDQQHSYKLPEIVIFFIWLTLVKERAETFTVRTVLYISIYCIFFRNPDQTLWVNYG